MIRKTIQKLKSEKAQALLETVLVIALISIAALGTLSAAGTNVSDIFTGIVSSLSGDETSGADENKEDPNRLVPLVAGTTFYNAAGTALTPEEDKYSDIAYCISTATMSWGGYNTAQWCGEGSKDYSGVLNTAKVLPVLKTESGTVWSYCDSIRTTTEDNTWYVPALGEIKDEYIAGGLKQLPLYVWTSTEGGTNQTSPTTSAMVFSTNGTVYNWGWQNKAGTTNSVAVLFRQNKFPDRNPEPFGQLDAYCIPFRTGKVQLIINSTKQTNTNKWCAFLAESETALPVVSRGVAVYDTISSNGILVSANGVLISANKTELYPADNKYMLLIETDSNYLPLATATFPIGEVGNMPLISISGKGAWFGYDADGNEIGNFADAKYLKSNSFITWNDFMNMELPDGFVRPDNSMLKINSADGTWNFDALDPGFKAIVNSYASSQIWSSDDSGTQAWCAQKSATVTPNAVLTDKTMSRVVYLVRQN